MLTQTPLALVFEETPFCVLERYTYSVQFITTFVPTNCTDNYKYLLLRNIPPCFGSWRSSSGII